MSDTKRIWPPPPLRPKIDAQPSLSRDTLTQYRWLDITLGVIAGLILMCLLILLFLESAKFYQLWNGDSGYNALYHIPGLLYYGVWGCILVFAICLYGPMRRFQALSFAYLITTILMSFLATSEAIVVNHLQLR